MTIREHQQFEQAIIFPAEVLLQAVKQKAKDGQMSESQCNDLAEGYSEAAEIARKRRVKGSRIAVA